MKHHTYMERRLELTRNRALPLLFGIGEDITLHALLAERIPIPSKKRFVTPKSLGQRRCIQAMRQHDPVMGIGPAGTGKTYLPMAMAVAGLDRKEFSRIILTRPAVEAGEKLGSLPGDLLEKVNPYLRPMYDALYDMLEFEKAQRLMYEQQQHAPSPNAHPERGLYRHDSEQSA